ncbi:methylated-DNA--[protein]-cysteine S-methyltransferase [Syntrophomonas curvata]
MYWHIFLTARGWAAVLGEKEVISASVLPIPLTSLGRYIGSTGHTARLIAMHDNSRRVINKFRAYYEGAVIEDWEAELKLDAFPRFSRRIMELVRTIPYGQTMTYAEVARAAGQPRAARAVGQVMKRNPLPLIVPCHRVVASNGPGGFTSSGGVQTKLNMLQWERKNLAGKGVL